MRRLVKEELGGDYIDARDAEARLDYLIGEKTDLETEVSIAEDALDDLHEDGDAGSEELEELDRNLSDAKEALADWERDYGDEYYALDAEASLIRIASDNGETLCQGVRRQRDE